MVPIACGIDRFHAVRAPAWGSYFSAPDVPGRVVTTLGRSSLFVYWIHVEMAYGGLARPLKRALPLEVSLVATVALCALLYADREVEGSQDAGRRADGRRGESWRRS